MSTAKNNKGGCSQILGYLLLGGTVLWVGSKVLQWLYYAFSYLGANTLLALDLSYGRLAAGAGYWPGYVLLGLGLGAAGGAIAAQQRFGLARSVAVAGGLVGLALLGVIYAVVAASTEPMAEPTAVARPPQAGASAARIVARPHSRSPAHAAKPDTSSQTIDYWGAALTQGRLWADWRDSATAGAPGVTAGDTLHVLRQVRGWGLAQTWSRAGGQPPGTGWVRLASLTPVATPSYEPAQPATPPVATRGWSSAEEVGEVRPRPAAASPPADSLAPAGSAVAAHPLGQQQHTGQVGGLGVRYTLDWRPSGELSGSYFYDQQPGTIYRLTGAVTPTGGLHLLEFTRGRQSAQCVLQRQGSGYAGQLTAADGRQLPMSLD